MRTAGGSHTLSVSCADSIPTPFVPSGHFPLIGGIGPWEGSQGGVHRRKCSEIGDDLSGAARQLPFARGAKGGAAEPMPPLVKGRCRAERGGEVP